LILALAVFPQIIKVHYVAVLRIERRLAAAALMLGLGAVLEVGMGWLGCTLGALTGLTLGWLAAVCLEALCMSWTIIRVARPGARLTSRQVHASPPRDADRGGHGFEGTSQVYEGESRSQRRSSRSLSGPAGESVSAGRSDEHASGFRRMV
jgi:hypothetical protein